MRLYLETLAAGDGPPARTSIEHDPVFGSPTTVARKLEPVVRTDIGGIVIPFRLGPRTFAETERSLRLFQEGAAPTLRRPKTSR